MRKQYSNDSRKFYQDYIQEIQLNKNGNFDFSKRGVQEQLRWNPQQAQNFPELVNDIKNAQRLPDVPNTKPLKKLMYHIMRFIEVKMEIITLKYPKVVNGDIILQKMLLLAVTILQVRVPIRASGLI